MHFPGFTIPTCILNMNSKYEGKPATWRKFESGELITKRYCMALFHPNVFDRSDLLMFLEYYPGRSVFVLMLIGYCIYFMKQEFFDPLLVGQFPTLLKNVANNRVLSVMISFCITPVMILLILVFDDIHDGF